MDEFNSLGYYSKTLSDLNLGKYNLTLLRKIQTKFGDSCIVKLEVDAEKENFLKKTPWRTI